MGFVLAACQPNKERVMPNIREAKSVAFSIARYYLIRQSPLAPFNTELASWLDVETPRDNSCESGFGTSDFCFSGFPMGENSYVFIASSRQGPAYSVKFYIDNGSVQTKCCAQDDRNDGKCYTSMPEKAEKICMNLVGITVGETF